MTARSTKIFVEILQYLNEAEEYFDQYADCEILSESGYHPNKEMVLRTGANMCMSLLTDLCNAMRDEELERLDRALKAAVETVSPIRYADAAERARMPDGSISASRFIAGCDREDSK